MTLMGEDCESSRCHSPVSLIHMVIFSVSNSVATLSSKSPPTIITATTSSNSGTSPQDATLVHKLFEGVLTSETRCPHLRNGLFRLHKSPALFTRYTRFRPATSRFWISRLTLSKTPVSLRGLRQFSASEMLCQKNKFFCDSCCDLQEAERRTVICITYLRPALLMRCYSMKIRETTQCLGFTFEAVQVSGGRAKVHQASLSGSFSHRTSAVQYC